jgi:hypothetical protein
MQFEKQHSELTVGQAAQRLLSDPALEICLDTLRISCFHEWAATSPDEVAARESAYAQMLGVNKVETTLRNWAARADALAAEKKDKK